MAPSPEAVRTPDPEPPRRRPFAAALAQRLSRVTSGEHLIPEVDGLRLFALMLVVLHHAVASYLTAVKPLGAIDIPMEWLRAGNASRFFFLVSHLGFDVHMFFVLSGFILSLPFLRAAMNGTPRPSLKRFYFRRLTRMEPPYVIALLLTFAVLVWQGSPFGSFVRHLGVSAVYLHGTVYGGASWIVPVAWSLEINAQFYLALPFLERLLFHRDRTTRRAWMVGIILAGGIASQLYLDTPLAPPAVTLSLVNWIQYFVAGFLLADLYLDYWRNRPATHPWDWDVLGIASFALLLAVVLQRFHPGVPWWVQRSWNGGAVAFLVPWLIMGTFAGVFRGRALKWLMTRRWIVIGGGMSYTVYLYHFTLIELLVRPVSRAIGSSLKPSATAALVYLVLLVPIFVVSAVLFVLVEKPFMAWRPPNPLDGLRRPRFLLASFYPKLTQRQAFLTAALLLVLVKCVQFALDSQALFFSDSGAFIRNALRLGFVPVRSYVYGDLIRVFALPFHSLRAIVAIQVTMGALTAWLLAFALMRFLCVRAWIAILASLVFAMDPMQIVHEHMVMTESASILAMALYLVAALKYLDSPSPYWLVALSFLGALLVSLRTVYLPVVVVAAVFLPVTACWFSARRTRLLTVALVVSCASTMLFQAGYRHLTGWLAHREPAYHYMTGFFLLASVTPIIQPGDSPDARVAAAVEAQRKSAFPLIAGLRSHQLWDADGLVAKLKAALGGNQRAADQAAQRLAMAAIRRNPVGFLRLGIRSYLTYWGKIPRLRWALEWENGMQPPHLVNAGDVRLVSSAFGADVSNQDKLFTLSRRYHIFARNWIVFLLLTPFLAGLALWLNPANRKGAVLLFVWNLLLLAATCFGTTGTYYRYLHPFSFTGLAAGAVLCEKWARRGVRE